ncbi:ABC transporter ATP-binding protein [Pasteuria penetrans]|uniref:ABC transporter ATP-binding protein n=1 Tax=Pasteuria penetrans TaxID=86005 RepID=UPI000FB04A12|nr:ABC transporter ATP-binding protein [Pasteuria penetrans]
MKILETKKLSKVYGQRVTYRALTDINMTANQGEFVGVMGPSGSGKTTLLNLIATIDTPTSGEVLINGCNPHELNKNKLSQFRRRELGFVFQDFNLLDTLTVGENIVLPLMLDKHSVRSMEEKLAIIAKKLDITELLDKRTYEISGGQMQRAAIARAIIHEPSLLLADEPTGNLDSKSSRNVMSIIETINQRENATIIMVTHDPVAASYCNRIIFIKDGQLHNQIQKGENQQKFFQQIIDVLSFLGGNMPSVSAESV